MWQSTNTQRLLPLCAEVSDIITRKTWGKNSLQSIEKSWPTTRVQYPAQGHTDCRGQGPNVQYNPGNTRVSMPNDELKFGKTGIQIQIQFKFPVASQATPFTSRRYFDDVIGYSH